MGIRAQARESRTCIAGNADGSGKHQQDQQERRHKDPRIKREKEAGKDWECERPRQTAGKVQAGGSRVVPLGDPENEVTTHRAVDKTRARHRPGAQEAARTAKSRGRKGQDRTQAGQKVQRLAQDDGWIVFYFEHCFRGPINRSFGVLWERN